jgi:hypothetical protein
MKKNIEGQVEPGRNAYGKSLMDDPFFADALVISVQDG